MMGRRGAKPCPVSSKRPLPTAEFPARHSPPESPRSVVALDFYTQAQKALLERSPFDAEDEAASPACPTLPASLASYLARHLDSRKRHKKSHLGAEPKSSRSEKPRRTSIWVETEGYFREVTLNDVECLREVPLLCSLATRECFTIPFPEDGNENGAVLAGNYSGEGVKGNGVGSDCGAIVKDEVVKADGQQSMEIDSVGVTVSLEEEKGFPVLPSLHLHSSIEWLLCCRDKIYLASERPNKKRKLLGSDAGLEKLFASCPVEGISNLCHYCCLGDMNDGLNPLMVCGSCKAAVHWRCYGVQENVHDSWLCTWCKHKNDVKVRGAVGCDLSSKPCVLCPKWGGALKPVYNRDPAEFAHLFCSQWMPEVYIEKTGLMEPIMNVDGIKETRRKLICYLCKVKHGSCVRCSNGMCRTSFHPICAREAKHRMEIWGKYGCDTVELRAFCSKHSDGQGGDTLQLGDRSVSVGVNSSVSKFPVIPPTNKSKMLKTDQQNGDRIAVQTESADASPKKMVHGKLQDVGMSDTQSTVTFQPKCNDVQEFCCTETDEGKNSENVNPSDFTSFAKFLKKLIDRGKVDLKDVALEIGVPLESLAAALTDDSLDSDQCSKIVKWLSNHAYMGTSRNNLKFKIKPTVSSEADIGPYNASSAAMVSKPDNPALPVKSVASEKISKNNVRILKDNKVLCSSKDILNDSGSMADKVRLNRSDGPENSSKGSNCMLSGSSVVADKFRPDQNDVIDNNINKGSFSGVVDKMFVEPIEFQDSLGVQLHKPEGIIVGPENCSENGVAEVPADNNQHALKDSVQEDPSCPVAGNPVFPDLLNTKRVSRSYIHPSIGEKMIEIQARILGLQDREFSLMVVSSGAGPGGCCNHQNEDPHSVDKMKKLDGLNLELLVKARDVGVLDLSPKDEVEGELIYLQHRLLGNAVARKQFNDDLIFKVVKGLPVEIDAVRKRRWDDVLVNQYLCDLREAKKQGRKERRHKEAQAILAAATAAAAASSRISSFKKDVPEDSFNQENLAKFSTPRGRPGLYPQVVSRTKVVPRVAVSSEKHSDFLQSVSDFSKEHPRTCDICRRSETVVNPILVCSGCKVTVHLDCYRSAKDSSGSWYCEFCEELSSKCSESPAINSWEKPYFVAECGLCGGTTGAFRKSTDGQWVHAFCAEWVFESAFRRGQVNLIEGMEAVCKGKDLCYICHRKHGVCLKCNYGHCQSTFHPSCARSVGLYMILKTTGSGGLLQHKAYCEKHSIEQKAKADVLKHGVDELKSMKQIRVELERLRLLCERIVKREKMKKELILCSHGILASKRDSVALSLLVHSSFFTTDVSSESATTSLKGHTDSYRSCSEAIQRSDDVTVDSSVSSKQRIKVPISMDNDQKTGDSSTSQHLFVRKPTERASFSGKQIPHRFSSVASQNLSDDGEKKLKPRKYTETFQKELVMTSDQATMKNQRLPKGYVYVPIGRLSKEKQASLDTNSHEQLEHDG